MIGTSTGEQYEDDFSYQIGETTDAVQGTPKLKPYDPFDPAMHTGKMGETEDKAKDLEVSEIPITAQPTQGPPIDLDALQAQAYEQLNAARESNLEKVYQQEAIEAARLRGIPVDKDPGEGRSPLDNLLGLTGERMQTWPERVIRDTLHAFGAPGRILEGKEYPSVEMAFEMAGGLVFGPMPVARKIVDGSLGSFAGVSSKTVDKEMLATAQFFDKRGYSPDAIYSTTGMWKGIDGKWRYEIPTQHAKFNNIPQTAIDEIVTQSKIHPTTLEKVLDFPELYAAYPDLKYMGVTFKQFNQAGESRTWGAYHHDVGKSPYGSVAINIETLTKEGLERTKSSLLHEVQHAIQKAEGFIPGANPKERFETFVRELNKKAIAAPTMSEFESIQQRISWLNQNRAKVTDQAYMRSPGEIEARLVQLRRFMTTSEREALSPERMRQMLELILRDKFYSPVPLPKEVAPSFWTTKPKPSIITTQDKEILVRALERGTNTK